MIEIGSDADIAKITYDRYEKYINPSMAQLVKFMGFEDVEIRSEDCYVYTSEGRRLLDCYGGPGVFSMGHSPAPIIAAVREQLEKMPLSSHILLNPTAGALAERLAESTPGDLQYTFFCNSGAGAVEGALKTARAYTGRKCFVATVGGFHGKTFGALSASGREVYREPFEPLVPGFTHVPFGDANALTEVVTDETAAVILEPIQGEAGVIVPPTGYLTTAREICDAAGALLILDEIQSGMARTGVMWACEREGVVPDVLTMGKALGGGVMPLGAFIARPDVWTIFEENPYLHTSTFGGNPLACAAGIAALDFIEQHDLCSVATERGAQMKSGFERVAADHPDMVTAVRGEGLLIGVQFGHADIAGLLIAALAGRNILAAYGLNNPGTIRFEPPLIISEAQVDEVIEAFDEALTSTASILEE